MGELQKKIESAITDALKNKEELRLSVLRLLKSSLKNASIALGTELADEAELKIIRQELKKRQDAAEAFKNGGRAELAEKEELEAKILQSYLPEQLDDAQLAQIIKSVVSEGRFAAKDFGQAMKVAMAKIGQQADGGRVSKILKEVL